MRSEFETLTARHRTYEVSEPWPTVPEEALSSHEYVGEDWPREREEVTISVSRETSEQPWFGATMERLQRLVALGPNWNGYGEARPHAASIKRAVAVLDAVAYRGPTPDMVPLADGGVQIEWHIADDSIEIVVPPRGAATVWHFRGDDEACWPLGPDEIGVTRLREALITLR
jgi:hypothetical protein